MSLFLALRQMLKKAPVRGLFMSGGERGHREAAPGSTNSPGGRYRTSLCFAAPLLRIRANCELARVQRVPHSSGLRYLRAAASELVRLYTYFKTIFYHINSLNNRQIFSGRLSSVIILRYFYTSGCRRGYGPGCLICNYQLIFALLFLFCLRTRPGHAILPPSQQFSNRKRSGNLADILGE